MHVLIVGAGPAGVASALLLVQRGVLVTLVERETDFDRVFRGEGLMPSGIDALHEMGLAGLLNELPGRKLESWDIYLEGEAIFSIPEPMDELGDRAMRVIPQPQFLERMIKLAAEFPGFKFEHGATVRDLVRDGDRVVGARLQTRQGPREIRADLVIGCDGRASVVRKRAELELELVPEHYDILWFKLPAPERLAGHCRMLLFASGNNAAACYTSWDDRLQYAWMLPKGGYAEVRGSDWAVELGRTAPEWLREHLVRERDAIEGPVVLDVIVGRAHEWSQPGLLLIGDAAHPMSPIRAQGVNVALRDAIVVANKLVPIARLEGSSGLDLAALDAAARAVQSEREPEINRAQTLQYRDARGIGSRAGPLLVKVAKHAGKLLGRYRWAGRAWLWAQRDLRFGSTEVRLEV